MARHTATSHRAKKKVRKRNNFTRWRKRAAWSLVVASLCVIVASLVITTLFPMPPKLGTTLLLVGGALMFTGAAVSPVNYGPEN